jgi:hypothetical protein
VPAADLILRLCLLKPGLFPLWEQLIEVLQYELKKLSIIEMEKFLQGFRRRRVYKDANALLSELQSRIRTLNRNHRHAQNGFHLSAVNFFGTCRTC